MKKRPALRAQVARNLRLWRALRGMRQIDLAEAVGVSQVAISKWERCEDLPSIDSLEKVAEAFGIHPALLMVDEGSSVAVGLRMPE